MLERQIRRWQIPANHLDTLLAEIADACGGYVMVSDPLTKELNVHWRLADGTKGDTIGIISIDEENA